MSILGGEENPAQSWLWELPSKQAFARRAGVETKFLSMCAFGAAWRENTRLLLWHCDTSFDGLRCTGRLCQFTHKKHEALTGTSDGVFRALAAQKYPAKFCDKIANALHAQITRSKTQKMWQHLSGGTSTLLGDGVIDYAALRAGVGGSS